MAGRSPRKTARRAARFLPFASRKRARRKHKRSKNKYICQPDEKRLPRVRPVRVVGRKSSPIALRAASRVESQPSLTLLIYKITMRSASKDSKPSAQLGSTSNARNGTSICVLDDDPSMLKALDRLLTSEGFSVEKFSEPANFLANIEQGPCRVAILDVWMPDMNGLEVQEVLRRNSPGTRIIFITGRDDASVRQVALEAGAFAFLSKPFDAEALLQLVRKAVAAQPVSS